MPDYFNKNVEIFNQDAQANEGYIYTATNRLSSNLATQRTTDCILETKYFTGRTVLDMGCGDGFYTTRFYDLGHPSKLYGVDGAKAAIDVANSNKGDRQIAFEVGDVHNLPYPDNSFDLVMLQSILHHDDNPADIIREAFRLAPLVLIHEPNGNNFGLKIIEKLSRYHREHHEKSYSTRQMIGWINQTGGKVVYKRFAGFVPMFCSDRIAKTTKMIEPLIERLPLINTLGCAIYVLVAERN
ncbi:class I SAM-dependent methyltransferase [Candidatus Chlorohelix sp.]|uniref:class I SAM-dependent methyltransferase n=1 Tax=Candidatus Chlorohelix sp. TaxID=3139201 RepID=UPI0030317B4C